MRRRLLTWLSVLSLLLAGTVLTAPAAVAHPYCGQVWGSLDKGVAGAPAGLLTDVRAGRHPCFDRLVLDLDAPLLGWSVRYVNQVVTADGQSVVPVRGGARLEVSARALATPTDAFFVGPDGTLIDTTRYRTFRHVVWAGSSPGVEASVDATTKIGLGVRARLPFRAFVLPGPGAGSRLVVDVGHRWCAPGHVHC